MATAQLIHTNSTSARSYDGRALLPAIAGGDEQKLTVLWSVYAGPVRRLARSLMSATAGDADDIVQETLIKVWRSAGSFDAARGTEATFVFTIARRVIIDRWRRTRTRPVEVELGERRPLLDVRAGGEYDRAIIRRVVAEAMASLSPEHHCVIDLAYMQGLTQREIAETLDLPLGTVKTRTVAALRELRTLLPVDDDPRPARSGNHAASPRPTRSGRVRAASGPQEARICSRRTSAWPQ